MKKLIGMFESIMNAKFENMNANMNAKFENMNAKITTMSGEITTILGFQIFRLPVCIRI